MSKQPNPTCPYCGQNMEYYSDNNPQFPRGRYICKACGAQAPIANSEIEAYVFAMRRSPSTQSKWAGR